MWRSVPQMEATLTLTRTSVRPYLGILTSRISAPGAASGLTTASMVLAVEVLGIGSSLMSAYLEEQTLYSTLALGCNPPQRRGTCRSSCPVRRLDPTGHRASRRRRFGGYGAFLPDRIRER